MPHWGFAMCTVPLLLHQKVTNHHNTISPNRANKPPLFGIIAMLHSILSMPLVILATISFVGLLAQGSCFRFDPAAHPPPFKTAAHAFVGSPSSEVILPSLAPKLYVLSGCVPPEPIGIPKRHVEYQKWMQSRRCTSTRVTRLEQLARVSKLVSGDGVVGRRSLRAEPSVVEVRWPNAVAPKRLGDEQLSQGETAQTTQLSPHMASVLQDASKALWPNTTRQLVPTLQAVLAYTPGDSFGKHVDRCEDTGQEGVMVVDLGLRDMPYNPTEPELFFLNTADEFMGEWSAAGPGSWVVFPMHHPHGVYPRVSRRVVAVFTLIDPQLQDVPLCAEYAGSCQLDSCRPGAPCIMT